MKLFRSMVLLLLLSGCTHSIHLVHTSGFEPYHDPAKGTLISAESEQFVVMFFSFDTDYVNEALSLLKDQCADGEITGITTQYSTSHGFFSWTNKILMQGHCFKATS